MKRKNYLIGLVLATTFILISPLFLASSAYASITLEPNFVGAVLVIFPNGEITVLEPGNPIPPIPSDSVLQVLHGQLTVATEKGDQVKLSCFNQSATVGGGSSAKLSCGEDSKNSGLLKVLKGYVSLITGEGKEPTVLQEGMDYFIKPSPEGEAPATGASDPTGGEPLGGNLGDPPPVDSRNIESSTFQ